MYEDLLKNLSFSYLQMQWYYICYVCIILLSAGLQLAWSLFLRKRSEMASVAFRMVRISCCSQASSDLPPVTSSAKEKCSSGYPGSQGATPWLKYRARHQSRSCSAPPRLHLYLVGQREITHFRSISLYRTRHRRDSTGGSQMGRPQSGHREVN